MSLKVFFKRLNLKVYYKNKNRLIKYIYIINRYIYAYSYIVENLL